MLSVHKICAVPNGEAILLASEKTGILVDTGYDYGSGRLAEKVKTILGQRPLAAVLLTHSHYDHASGCAGIKKCYPNTDVVASALTAELLEKEKVRQAFRRLNKVVSEQYGEPYINHLDNLKVDTALCDQDRVEVGAYTVIALETPGHTRCCMSYYIPEEEMLLCSESLGTWIGGRLHPAFVVSLSMTLESIERCAALKPKRVVVSHYGEWSNDESEGFFAQAKRLAEDAAAFVYDRYRRGLPQETIVEDYVKEYYGRDHGLPEEAVSVNTSTMVARLIERLA